MTDDLVTRLRGVSAIFTDSDDEEIFTACHDAADEIVRLRAEVETVRAEERERDEKWQPISTAPRDGRLILAFFDVKESPFNKFKRAERVQVVWYSPDRGWVMVGINGLCPSHWQPLPRPPK